MAKITVQNTEMIHNPNFKVVEKPKHYKYENHDNN